MAIDNFIPEIWSAGVTTSFQKAQVVIPNTNSAYTGEARRGNTVHIIGAVTPTITDYADAGRQISAEALADTSIDLLINQEKAFSFLVDDVDKAQAAGSFDAWTMAAGGALAEDAEAYVLAQMIANAGNDVTPTTVASEAEAKDAVLAIRTQLTKNKVPAAGRFVAVNPAMAELLLGSLSDAAVAGSDGELRNGLLGRIYGMDVLETPLFAEATAPVAVGFHQSAVAFVSQVEETEAIRSQNSFADIVRGLHVYGAKVVRSAGVVKVVAD